MEITGGFWLVILWFAAVNGWDLLAVVLGAAFIHEMGHCVVLRMCGARIWGLKLGLFGAELKIDSGRLSYGAETAAVLAGPSANLLAAVLLVAFGGTSVSVGANVSLCLFNLLPVRPLDGGRAFALIAEWIAGPEAGEQAVRWMGAFSGTALAAGLLYVMWQTGGSLWLIPPAWGLLIAAWKEVVGNESCGVVLGRELLDRSMAKNGKILIKKKK